MDHEGGDIVLPGTIFKRLCAGLKSRKNIRFYTDYNTLSGLPLGNPFGPSVAIIASALMTIAL